MGEILIFKAQFLVYLFSGVRREVEDEHAEERDQHGGQDQVHRVEEGLPPDRDVERDVRLRGHGLVVHVQVGGHLDDVPRAGLPVVAQVHVVLVVVQRQRDLVAARRWWNKSGAG